MSTMMAGRLLVDAPRRPYRLYGLFGAVDFRMAEADHWQAAGFEWESVGCDRLPPVLRQGCDRPDDDEGFPKDLSGLGGPDVVESKDPFTVYATYQCQLVGRPVAEAQAIADRRLLAGEEQAVTDWLIAELVDGAGVLPSAEDPAVALGSVELADPAVIIMDRRTAATLSAAGLVSGNGRQMATGQGTRVVLSSTPTIPPGLMVGTGPIVGYRSEPFSSSNRPGDLLDRADNTFTAISERTYAIGWEPCGQGAAVARLGVLPIPEVTL